MVYAAKTKLYFLISLFSFRGCGYKDIQKLQKTHPPKQFLETLSLFSDHENQKKQKNRGFYQTWIGHVM